MLTLNRKPTTLAQTLSPEAWRSIGDCAITRHRLAADGQAWDRCNGESAASSMAFAQARLARDPFPVVVADGIRHYGAIPTINGLAIDREHHLTQAINSKPLTVPDYVDRLLCDEPAGWRETVCAYLRAVDDENREFDWRNFSLSGDLSGEIDFVVFVPIKSADFFWSADSFIVADGLLYRMDGTLGDSGLLDERIGWHVCDLGGEYVDGFDSLASGYAANPTGEIERILVGTPTWHYGLSCFLGRLDGYDHPVRLYPEPPFYGG